MMRLAIVASHPVQYYAPLFRELAQRLDLTVFYAHRVKPADQAAAGFGVGFEWDVDLLCGYRHEFLENAAREPGLNRFGGVDTPAISQILRQGRFDAVMLMGWHLKCFLQALFAAKRAGLPVMVRGDSHLETPRSFLKILGKRLLYPVFLRQFNSALFVGKRNRLYWEHYGFPPERMFHSPHCVDNEWFAARASQEAREQLRSSYGIPQSAKVVLFAGKFIPLKRIADLLYAMKEVERRTDQQTHLVLAGSGPLEPELRSIASVLSLSCHWLGFCNQSVMPAVYAASDLVVLPSEHETWGLAVNEALACDRPVIVSDAVGCAPDMAAQLGDEVVFKMGDVTQLGDRIVSLLFAPPSRKALAAASSSFSATSAASGIVSAATMLAWNQRR